MMDTTNTLELPLSSVGLLLRLLSLAGVWVALVALFTVPCRCFPTQGSVYSAFSLFEDQALKQLGVSAVVLSCSGLDLPTLLF